MMTNTCPRWETPKYDDNSTRFELLQEIASGGMATVYLGCRRGPLGFERLVAIKRSRGIDPRDGEHVGQLSREAALAARVHHPNVVSIVDAEMENGELLLIMEYIEGASLAQLMTAGPLHPAVVARIVTDTCEGLTAVHTAKDELGTPLGLVHRDVSPQNVLIGLDGVARIADFGIALSRRSVRTTSHRLRRGKPGYMAPEYLLDGAPRATYDVYALGVVLWEALTGQRLFAHATSLRKLLAQLGKRVKAPSRFVPGLSDSWDRLVLRALGRSEEGGFLSARDLGGAIEQTCNGAMASRLEVGHLVESVAHESIARRRAIVRERRRASHPELRDTTPVSCSFTPAPSSPTATTMRLEAAPISTSDVTVPVFAIPETPAPQRRHRTTRSLSRARFAGFSFFVVTLIGVLAGFVLCALIVHLSQLLSSP